jgi:hypothetical protein
MTAEEARKITEEAKLISLEYVFYQITEAANNGCSYLYVTYELSSPAIVRLKYLGYRVEDGNALSVQKDNWHHKIIW